MTGKLKSLTALAEDTDWFPTTYMGLSTIWNSSSRESGTIFYFLKTSVIDVVHADKYTHKISINES